MQNKSELLAVLLEVWLRFSLQLGTKRGSGGISVLKKVECLLREEQLLDEDGHPLTTKSVPSKQEERYWTCASCQTRFPYHYACAMDAKTGRVWCLTCADSKAAHLLKDKYSEEDIVSKLLENGGEITPLLSTIRAEQILSYPLSNLWYRVTVEQALFDVLKGEEQKRSLGVARQKLETHLAEKCNQMAKENMKQRHT